MCAWLQNSTEGRAFPCSSWCCALRQIHTQQPPAQIWLHALWRNQTLQRHITFFKIVNSNVMKSKKRQKNSYGLKKTREMKTVYNTWFWTQSGRWIFCACMCSVFMCMMFVGWCLPVVSVWADLNVEMSSSVASLTSFLYFWQALTEPRARHLDWDGYPIRSKDLPVSTPTQQDCRNEVPLSSFTRMLGIQTSDLTLAKEPLWSVIRLCSPENKIELNL